MGQDLLQLFLAGHEGDLAGGTFHRSDKVARVDLVRRRVGWQVLRYLIPCLIDVHPAGQRVQRGVLGLGQHRLQCLKVSLAGQQPDERAGSERRRQGGSGRRR